MQRAINIGRGLLALVAYHTIRKFVQFHQVTNSIRKPYLIQHNFTCHANLSSWAAKEIQARSKYNIAIIPRAKGKWAYGSWSDCFTTVIGQDPLFTTKLLTLPMMALQKYEQTPIKQNPYPNQAWQSGRRDLNYCPNKQSSLLFNIQTRKKNIPMCLGIFSPSITTEHMQRRNRIFLCTGGKTLSKIKYS